MRCGTCTFEAAFLVLCSTLFLLTGGFMEGLFQPIHLLLILAFFGCIFGGLYLAVRIVRAAWKR